MIWYDDLFVGESIRPRRQKRIIRKVKKRSLFNSAYLLTLASNPDNLIDIVHARVVRQRYYPKKELIVIGLAGSYDEAMELAGMILSSYYQARGNFEFRDFVKHHQSGHIKKRKGGLL